MEKKKKRKKGENPPWDQTSKEGLAFMVSTPIPNAAQTIEWDRPSSFRGLDGFEARKKGEYTNGCMGE